MTSTINGYREQIRAQASFLFSRSSPRIAMTRDQVFDIILQRLPTPGPVFPWFRASLIYRYGGVEKVAAEGANEYDMGSAMESLLVFLAEQTAQRGDLKGDKREMWIDEGDSWKEGSLLSEFS